MTNPCNYKIETPLSQATRLPGLQAVPYGQRVQYGIFPAYEADHRDVFVFGRVFIPVADRVQAPLRNYLRWNTR